MTKSRESESNNSKSLLGSLIKVDFRGLEKPAEKLIDAIARGIGIVHLPRRMKRLASTSVEVSKMLDLTKQETKGLYGRALLMSQGQLIRQQENIETIVQNAVNALPESVDENPVDEDWVAHFFEHCKNVDNEEMQILWGRLLAGEVAEPGSFSKRTLDFVKSLSTEEAQLFTNYCRFLMKFHDEDYPFRMSSDAIDSYLEENVGDYRYWGHLSDIGLIHAGGIISQKKEAICYHIHYFNREFKMQHPGSGSSLPKILFGIDRLTMTGFELFHIANPEPDYEYFNQFINLGEQGIKITVINSDNKN